MLVVSLGFIVSGLLFLCFGTCEGPGCLMGVIGPLATRRNFARCCGTSKGLMVVTSGGRRSSLFQGAVPGFVAICSSRRTGFASFYTYFEGMDCYPLGLMKTTYSD